MKTIEITDSRGTLYRITADLIASVDSSKDSTSERVRDYWTVLELYRTQRGEHVLVSKGLSTLPHVEPRIAVRRIPKEHDPVDQIRWALDRPGRGTWMTDLLIRRAGFEQTQTIE